MTQSTESLNYLRAHHIPELIENLIAGLVYARPEDPRQYLIEKIENLRDARDTKQPPHHPLFAEQNIRGCFSLFDVSGRGTITLEQYKQG
jgi:hypothetical protein